MSFALFLLVLCLVALFLVSYAKKPDSSAEEFPVTIIKDGESVTFNGYDTARLEREFAAAIGSCGTENRSLKTLPAATERMTVAITGTLSEPRAEVAIKINSTKNARFVDRVFLDTDYLVATRTDTAKARAAAKNGTVILNEQQLREYLTSGEFPFHPRRLTHVAPNFNESEIFWEQTYDPPVQYRLSYRDSSGECSERFVEVVHPTGKHPNGHEYLAALDGGQLKTFRKDRILNLDRLG